MGDGPAKSGRVATVETLKEKKGIVTMNIQQDDVINKPEVRFGDFRKSHEEISIG
jgi:hypothetical protein